MYTNYSATPFALRAKWSFYNYLSSNDYGYGYGSQSCSQSALYSIPRNPRFIYYGYLLRRHSTLLGPRRTVRVCDAGLDDVIGLLAGSPRRRCCRCCRVEGFEGSDRDFDKSSRKLGSWSDDYRDSSKKERTWKKEGGCRGVRGSRPNYDSVKSSSFSGDFEGRGVERRRIDGGRKGSGIGRVDFEEKLVREVRKYADDENFFRASRNESKRRGFDRRFRNEEENFDSEREEEYAYEEPRVHNGSSRREVSERRSRVAGEKVDNWRDSGCKAREEEYVYEDSRVRNRRSEDSTRRSRVEEENVDDWRDSGRRMRDEYVQEEEQEGFGKFARSSERDGYSEYKKESDARNVVRGESSISVLKRQNEIDKRVVGQADSRKSSLRGCNFEMVSDLQRRIAEERMMKDREERSTSLKNFVELTRDEGTRNDQRTIDKVEVDEQFVTRASDSRFLASDTERANNSKGYLEIRRDDERASSSQRRIEKERTKREEEKSISVENLVRVRRDERTEVNQQVTNNIEINEKYENQTNSSRIRSSNTERVNNSNSSLRIRADDREEHSTSVVNLAHEIRNNSRIESKRDSSVSELRMSDTERVSNFQELSTIRTENESETSSSVRVLDEEDNRQMNNLIGESLLSTRTQVGTSGGSSHVGSSSVFQVKDDAMESASRYDESSAIYLEEFVDRLRQERLALDIAEANEEKIRRKAYQEATAVELGADDDLTRHGEKYIEETGGQSSSKSGMKGPSDEMWEVRGQSSQEPSKIKEENEKPRESPAAEVVDSKTSPGIAENAITRRSSRSLWTYIADIMKIGWAHRAGTHSSAKKSGGGSSSNESIGSEAWFSGHEPDENDDETEKKESDVLPKEAVLSKKHVEQYQVNVSTSMGTAKRRMLSKSTSLPEEIERSEDGKGRQGTLSGKLTIDQSSVPTGNISSSSLTETGNVQMHISNSPNSEEEFGRQKQPEVTVTGGRYGELKKRNVPPKESMQAGRPVEESNVGLSTSTETMRRASSSKGIILVPAGEDFESSGGDMGRRGILSSVDQSSIVASTAGMAPPSIPEIGGVQISGSRLPKLEEITVGEKLLEVGGTEGMEGELKRRKFQRNKQVLREQFEEWEEAYKLESEQRKIDEFFMMEALLEAKKAADTWEVPVGAVLVQNGKIIARGCNLVEELRDSTAHAEMICIREASNLLRSWRLAETTLYVTLEPCAMCAGAILQARIDTVVWGAPNKLLGADGSWVRLFPTGDGGGSSLGPSIQTAGPVHPFHPKITIRRGILATECADAMQQFFQLRRKKNNKQEQPPTLPSCLPISAQPTKLFTRMHNIFSVMFCL